MADNKINVTVSANTRKNITVSSAQVSTEITASADTGRFWAQTAKNWAVSDVIVDNTDHSSKYYANKAKESANNAQEFESTIRDVYNGFLGETTGAVENVQSARDEAITNIETSRVEAIDSINSTKTTILNDIEFVADGEKKEIEDLIDSGKDELKEISATEQAELEEIKEGIINYAGIYYEEIADEDIDVDILEQGYVSDLELKEALDTKQDKGDYALKEDIPSLEGYVKNTDYATPNTGGVIRTAGSYGVNVSSSGYLNGVIRSLQEYNDGQPTMIISKSTLENIKDDYVKRGVTTNTIQLTEDEKANAKNWLGYATPTDIMQAIASIPQFKLSIVEELPLAGEKMTLYLVSKGTESPDVYDEYIWIEETSSFEFLGTTAVDLNDYVKKTDYAKSGSAGIINVAGSYGTTTSASGYLRAVQKNLAEYNESQDYLFVAKGTLENIKDDYIKRGITTNTIELTEEEKTSARTWLGAIGSTDYAGTDKHGVIRVTPTYGLQVDQRSGYLFGAEKTLQQYDQMAGYGVVSKSTLDNVLTQYSKTVSLTQADYEALETVDETTLYLIEE